MATKTTKEKTAKDAKEIVEDVKKVTKETVDEVKKTAKDTVDEVKKTAKKTASKAKAAAKKTTARATKTKVSTHIQYLGKDLLQTDIEASALAQFKELYPEIPAKTMDLYVNTDDNAAYYVINGEHTGCIHF